MREDLSIAVVRGVEESVLHNAVEVVNAGYGFLAQPPMSG